MMEYILPYKKWAESLKNGKLLGLRCKQCNSIITPPLAVCSCGSKDFDVIELSGEGKIVTFTIVRVPPEGFKPSIVALVELKEGTMVVGNVLCGIDEADMSLIGKDIEVGWKEVKGDKFSSGDRVILTFKIK